MKPSTIDLSLAGLPKYYHKALQRLNDNTLLLDKALPENWFCWVEAGLPSVLMPKHGKDICLLIVNQRTLHKDFKPGKQHGKHTTNTWHSANIGARQSPKTHLVNRWHLENQRNGWQPCPQVMAPDWARPFVSSRRQPTFFAYKDILTLGKHLLRYEIFGVPSLSSVTLGKEVVVYIFTFTKSWFPVVKPLIIDWCMCDGCFPFTKTPSQASVRLGMIQLCRISIYYT
jgi:hypothetical protein